MPPTCSEVPLACVVRASELHRRWILMRKLINSLLVVLALSIAPILHAQCAAANNQAFTASLLGSNTTGFGNAMLTFNQNGIGTLSSSTIGLGNNINSLQLFAGNPAGGGQMIQTFTTTNNSF